VYVIASSVIMLWSKPAKRAVSFAENTYFFCTMKYVVQLVASIAKQMETAARLGYLAMSNNNFLQMFRYYLLVQSSRDSILDPLNGTP